MPIVANFQHKAEIFNEIWKFIRALARLPPPFDGDKFRHPVMAAASGVDYVRAVRVNIGNDRRISQEEGVVSMTRHNRARKILVGLALGLLALGLAGAGIWYGLIQMGLLVISVDRDPAPYPAPAATRDGRWAQDLDCLATQLVYLHAGAFHTVSRERFDAEVERLRAALPTLDDRQIIARFAQIAALIDDGHTYAAVHESPLIHLFPLELRWYGEALIVTSAQAEDQHAVGAAVVYIGDMPIAEAVEAVTPFISADNAYHFKGRSPHFLVTPAVLYAAGVLPSPERATYTLLRDGETFTLTVNAVQSTARPALIGLYEALEITPPLSQQHRDQHYWYTFLDDNRTLYVQYNVCQDDPTQPFAAFVAEMFASADAHAVQRVVVDLRYNSGGASRLFAPFIQEIRRRPALNTEDGLRVLIGRGTFSSAMQNAIQLRRETNATLMGEPTGGQPNGYGEVRSFTLPNSRLRIQYSTAYFRNLPGSRADAVTPDVWVETLAAAALAGEDSVLAAALGQS